MSLSVQESKDRAQAFQSKTSLRVTHLKYEILWTKLVLHNKVYTTIKEITQNYTHYTLKFKGPIFSLKDNSDMGKKVAKTENKEVHGGNRTSSPQLA